MIEYIIGLNGRLHSGKDTAYAEIDLYFAASGLKAKRIAFADPLKLSGVLALGFEPQSIEEAVDIANILKEKASIVTQLDETGRALSKVSGRKFWQLYGTEAHRDVFGQDFWVDASLPNDLSLVDDKHTDAEVLVVTDVRFPNEAQRILDLGGEVWEIDATERLGELPADAHPSEHPLDRNLVSRSIDNNGTVEDFHSNLHNALDGM